MFLGLSIKGKVVKGRVNQDNVIYKKLLGAPLCEDKTRSQCINLKYLKQYYSSIILTEDSTEYDSVWSFFIS